MRASSGGTLRLANYRGKVVLLAFGYTSCPEVCPITLAILAQARRKLARTRTSVQVVYVTVDPERDDVARMRQFLALFDPSFVGGTGSPASWPRCASTTASPPRDSDTADGYVIAHSSFVYLIDRAAGCAR